MEFLDCSGGVTRNKLQSRRAAVSDKPIFGEACDCIHNQANPGSTTDHNCDKQHPTIRFASELGHVNSIPTFLGHRTHAHVR